MHLIEEFLGFAPDGGSGLLEAILFLTPIAALLLYWRRDQSGFKMSVLKVITHRDRARIFPSISLKNFSELCRIVVAIARRPVTSFNARHWSSSSLRRQIPLP
jgi:hypothetical protein